MKDKIFTPLKSQLPDCVLLGDKRYLSQRVQVDLFNKVNIQLENPKRANQKDYKSQFYPFKKYLGEELKLCFHNFVINL